MVGNAMAALSPDSSDHQRKIETLIDLIERQATTIRKSHSNSKLDPLIFSIKKVYTKANRGTEVTGVIESGIIHKGDNVEIVGYDKVFRTSVLNIESFRRSQTETGAGESAALLLKSIKKEDVCRGMMVITADNLDLVDAKQRIQVSSNSTTPKNHPFRVHMSDHLRAEIQLLDSIDNPKAKPLSNCNSNLIMFGRTFDIRTLVRFIDSNHQSHGPGDRFEVDLKLLKSMAITLHQPFVLRDSASTIAFGRISKIQSASTLTDRDSITVHRK